MITWLFQKAFETSTPQMIAVYQEHLLLYPVNLDHKIIIKQCHDLIIFYKETISSIFPIRIRNDLSQTTKTITNFCFHDLIDQTTRMVFELSSQISEGENDKKEYIPTRVERNVMWNTQGAHNLIHQSWDYRQLHSPDQTQNAKNLESNCWCLCSCFLPPVDPQNFLIAWAYELYSFYFFLRLEGHSVTYTTHVTLPIMFRISTL